MHELLNEMTIKEIAGDIAIFVGLITAGIFLYNKLKVVITNMLKNQFDSMNNKLDSIEDKVDKVDMNATRNFLVRCIQDFEANTPLDETTVERFWEQYDHYINHGENSYIKSKVEKLKKEGKI